MLETTTIILLSVFAAYGMLSIFFKIVLLNTQHLNKIVFIEGGNDCEIVEWKIRSVVNQYPSSQIYVLHDDSNSETNDILSKLCKDYPYINIINIDDINENILKI